MNQYSNRKSRIEKKITKRAMELLLKLSPNYYGKGDFYLDEEQCEWYCGKTDYYGEFDAYDAFYELHKNLIIQTTDWKGGYEAEENNEDKTPYYSPWRIGGKIGRKEVISHCHRLAKTGVVWG
ncbi:hypothetical protein KTP48_13045 [Proteus mirabilis]|uniref:hypothetical protein n=1 Tax=Proteus mirabilis TaxID=584 RepID=UPI001C2BD7C6|nr:hypothetical protein [Proteus mirabilis]MBU9979665.1 hypothetical protein [Proteus mirabilis]